MRKLIYLASLLIVAVVAFTACSKDEDSQSYSVTPARDVQGTYSGKWYEVQSDAADTTVYEGGTVTLSAVDSCAYVVAVQAVNPSLTVDYSGVANIQNSNNCYPFYNMQTDTKANTFGRVFRGWVKENQVTLIYTASKKVGRKTYGFTYTFVGQKQ